MPRSTISSNSGGNAALSELGGGSGALTMACISAYGPSPSNGKRPVAHWYNMTLNEY
jgi:hypothetical protein